MHFFLNINIVKYLVPVVRLFFCYDDYDENNYFYTTTFNQKKKKKSKEKKGKNTHILVVAGTIAPSRELPELTAEDTIRIILANLNLIVPVVASVFVLIIAIVVICILRSKGDHHKGITKTFIFY